jgi:hypothetical protein
MNEMLEIVLSDGTHLQVPMAAVLQALGQDCKLANNIGTRRMHQYSPGQLVEVTTRFHPGTVRMDSLERWSE